MLGENLGVISILCFTQGFTANYFCRLCRVHKSEAKLLWSERQDYLRNEENCEKDVKLKNLEETGNNQRLAFFNFNHSGN